MLDGVFNESANSAIVIVQPGQEFSSIIPLNVLTSQSYNEDRLDGPRCSNLVTISIWVIRSPDGLSNKSPTNGDSDFTFSDLPIDRYIFTSEAETLKARGVTANVASLGMSTIVASGDTPES